MKNNKDSDKKSVTRPSLFLDRDGVINKRLPGRYVTHVGAFEFCEGVVEALRLLSAKFDPIVIVTNQAGVGKELMTYEDLEAIHQHMLTEINRGGGRIDKIYVCTELQDEEDNCRKPSPAMGVRAMMDFKKIKPQNTWMVGDSVVDIQFGQNLGFKTCLITGHDEQAEDLKKMKPDLVLDALLAFAQKSKF